MKEYKITKERLEAMAKKCPEAKEVLKEGFPEAFKKEEGWEDISAEVDVALREDGVIQINHNGVCWGHLALFGRGEWEFYWVGDGYKERVENRSIHILKRRSK